MNFEDIFGILDHWTGLV